MISKFSSQESQPSWVCLRICPVKPSIEKLAKQLDISGDFVELCTNESRQTNEWHLKEGYVRANHFWPEIIQKFPDLQTVWLWFVSILFSSTLVHALQGENRGEGGKAGATKWKMKRHVQFLLQEPKLFH